ncbi:MAG: MFS transporter [Chloroflexi bacterium]|nr:MFS transporter [Chloroflexota bacterium]
MTERLRVAGPVATSRRAWFVVAALFFVMLISSGIRSAFGVFLHPLLEQFGTSRAAVSLAFTINSIVFGMAQPLVGRTLDRHGLRAVVLPGAVIMAASLALLPAARDLWQLYLLYGGIHALGLAGTNTAVAFPVAVRWVRQRRGPVLGVLAAAGMVGSFVLVPGTMFLLLSVGWQGMLLVLTGLAGPSAARPPARRRAARPGRRAHAGGPARHRLARSPALARLLVPGAAQRRQRLQRDARAGALRPAAARPRPGASTGRQRVGPDLRAGRRRRPGHGLRRRARGLQPRPAHGLPRPRRRSLPGAARR